tara:strand:+ start:9097 stop:9549 length:453 start_codon:yes stop_codon:yes gene_type:complete
LARLSKPINLNTRRYIAKRDGTDGNAAIARIQRDIEDVKNEADEARGRIPPNWGEQRGKYTALAKAEKRARTIYRRTVDRAFGPVVETVEIIQQAEAPAAIGDRLKALPGILSSQALEKAVAEFRAAKNYSIAFPKPAMSTLIFLVAGAI